MCVRRVRWVRLRTQAIKKSTQPLGCLNRADQPTYGVSNKHTSFIRMRTFRALLPPNATRDVTNTLASVANTSLKCSPSVESDTENDRAGNSQKISIFCKSRTTPKSTKNSTGSAVSSNFEAQNVSICASTAIAANAAPSLTRCFHMNCHVDNEEGYKQDWRMEFSDVDSGR